MGMLILIFQGFFIIIGIGVLLYLLPLFLMILWLPFELLFHWKDIKNKTGEYAVFKESNQ